DHLSCTVCVVFFFFSSRRRHTRLVSDWSSDVCSSDLFCRESGIAFVDLLPAFWGLDGTRFWISRTDGHPNARGHRIIAETLAKRSEERRVGKECRYRRWAGQ